MPNERMNIYFSISDGASPVLKAIGDQTRSLDKENQRLQQSYEALKKANNDLVAKQTELEEALKAAKLECKDAKKAFEELGDAASADAYEAAKRKQEDLQVALKNTNSAIRQNEKIFKSNVDTIRKELNQDSGNGLFEKLGQAGLYKMVGDAASQLAGSFLGSAVGQNAASAISSTLSSAATGFALGGLPGAAVGAIAGGISGATQIFEAKDSAFKSYVQEQAQNVMEEQSNSLTTGSAIAAGRETDRISFATLFGDAGVADTYLANLVSMSNNTPFLYDDLTAMSKTLATYNYGADEILPVLQTIGDTGAALGMSTSDMTMVATALGRMKSSNKTSLEYLNILNDRGIGAVGMLSEAYGVDQGTMYDMISKGQIEGSKAAEIILQAMMDSFAGSMENQSKTFSGLTSTVEGLTQELDNAMGEGYNEGRMAGLQAQRDWLSGESGEAVMEANKAIGAWKAELENSKEQYIRDAVDAMMASGEYQTAKASGDAAEMGRLIMEAKVQGMNEYNASDGAQLALESEMALAKAIREDTATNDAYWDAGYQKGQEYSKGLIAGLLPADEVSEALSGIQGTPGAFVRHGVSGFAYGLDRVPYNGFPAILHEGERVLTANQARAMDEESGESSLQITITGNTFQGTGEEMVDQIASLLLEKLQTARMSG